MSRTKDSVEGLRETNTSLGDLLLNTGDVGLVVVLSKVESVRDLVASGDFVHVVAGDVKRLIGPDRGTVLLGLVTSLPRGNLRGEFTTVDAVDVILDVVVHSVEVAVEALVKDVGIPNAVKVGTASKEVSVKGVATMIGSVGDVKRLMDISNKVGNELEGDILGVKVGAGQLRGVVGNGTSNTPVVGAILLETEGALTKRNVDVVEGLGPGVAAVVVDLVSPRSNISKGLTVEDLGDALSDITGEVVHGNRGNNEVTILSPHGSHLVVGGKLIGHGGRSEEVVENGSETNTSHGELSVDDFVTSVVVVLTEVEVVLDDVTVGVTVGVHTGGACGAIGPHGDTGVKVVEVAGGPLGGVGGPRSADLLEKIVGVVSITGAEVVVHTLEEDAAIPHVVKVDMVSVVLSLDGVTTIVGGESNMKGLVDVTNKVGEELEGNVGLVARNTRGDLLGVVGDGPGDTHVAGAVTGVGVVAGPVGGVDEMKGLGPCPSALVLDVVSPGGDFLETLTLEDLVHNGCNIVLEKRLSDTGGDLVAIGSPKRGGGGHGEHANEGSENEDLHHNCLREFSVFKTMKKERNKMWDTLFPYEKDCLFVLLTTDREDRG